MTRGKRRQAGVFAAGLMMAAFPFVLVQCAQDDSGDSVDIQETGQQVGDVMASIDESGGTSSGSFALAEPDAAERTFARLAPEEVLGPWWRNLGVPAAFAATCAGSGTFGGCTSNVITRTFDSCTVGLATLDGTVTLTFDDDVDNDNTCQMTAEGHSVTRVPDFTITGRRGATLTVSKTGDVGQTVTKGSGSTFTFTNDGIRRKFVNSAGTTTFDFTTETTEAITVTGASRAERTLDGGTLRVTNNLTDVTCDLSPDAVTWTSTCNCPVSGSWAGTCSDGSTITLDLTGCGTANLTIGSSTEAFTFDRCYGTS